MGNATNSSVNWHKYIAILASIPLFFIELYAINAESHWKWDFIFIILSLYGLYFLRNKIHLHPIHYLMFSLFLLLHFLGTFKLYETFPLGIEYDYWVHGSFGFVASLILIRFYNFLNLYTDKWMKLLAVLVVVLGFSAFHELFEYSGALLLGEGEGVLYIGAGDIDEWDTQKDMLNNLIGGVVGLVGYHTTKKIFFRQPNRRKAKT